MGKRNKSKSLMKNNAGEKISSELVNREEEHPVKAKKNKLKHKKDEGKNISENYEDALTNRESTKSKVSGTKKAEGESNINTEIEKPKKIIFVNDEPQDVALGVASGSKRKNKKNKVNNDINDESLVKDEDINDFCDELTDQDNEQYEEWVQLLEAKLHPNKKS